MKKESDSPRILRRNVKFGYISSLLLFLLLSSSCTGLEPVPSGLEGIGPQAWVEFPYTGSTLPMGPVTLVVYAADPGGISYIQLTINGEALPAMAVAPLTADGSTRLARIDHSWQPPAEGEYLVEAVGSSANGTVGQPGSTRFCIVTCNPDLETETIDVTPTWTPTPAPGVTITPTSTYTPPPPSANVTVSFYASPSSVDAGSCATLHWDVKGTETVYLDGNSVYYLGMEEHCPCETESHTLRVIKPDGSSQDYYATIEAYGSCEALAPEPPPVQSDTTGPTFNGVYAYWEGCTIYGQADISDPSGVSWAEFHYNLNNEGWNWILMNQSGNLWTSQVGVSVSDGLGTPQGNLKYKVRALDTYNNERWSGEDTINYLGCGGFQ